ncbi:SDR family NAD(P)-dependent oxidoreductase [Maricurvus nonylphenolicus]|uniref:SDR family NAD(P)-dependent oxidoreductase n=1 Tax=Maricurvus nonylphenolicus TaxID=1008307 RepID=UPI0036F3B4B2
MNKTILITGSTDGIGLATAKTLAKFGHTVLLHGRSQSKLDSAKAQLLELTSETQVETYSADLSVLSEVEALASEVSAGHDSLDILINNAGVFVVPETVSVDGLDVRFVVNTIAPYLLTKRLLPLLGKSARVINLSSAAQAPVNPDELTRPSSLSDSAVYAKSKLAITMWSMGLASSLVEGPVVIAVNPASFLGSKMVKDAYGKQGGDLQKGADILVRAALADEFAQASGQYFDNDIGQFTSPHLDAMDSANVSNMVNSLEQILINFNIKNTQ